MMQCNAYCMYGYVRICISYTCVLHKDHLKVIADVVCFRPGFEMVFKGAACWGYILYCRCYADMQMIVAFTDNTDCLKVMILNGTSQSPLVE